MQNAFLQSFRGSPCKNTFKMLEFKTFKEISKYSYETKSNCDTIAQVLLPIL